MRVLLLPTQTRFCPKDNVTLHTGVLEAVCGALGRPRPPVTCSPEPDAFSPCEDLMGNWLLRLSVWAVSVAALLGNGTVLLVLLSPRRRLSVPRYLMCHLAAADLAMGAYLLMLAVMDAVSIGAYFNYAIDWQNGECPLSTRPTSSSRHGIVGPRPILMGHVSRVTDVFRYSSRCCFRRCRNAGRAAAGTAARDCRDFP